MLSPMRLSGLAKLGLPALSKLSLAFLVIS